MHSNKDISRFWDKVDQSGDCWEWTGGHFTQGYSAFGYGKNQPGYAHRFSYEIHHGPIPEGKIVMHTCDNRGCVNPDHLKAGTQRDNIIDAVNKGRWMSDARRKHLAAGKHGLRYRYKHAWGNG